MANTRSRTPKQPAQRQNPPGYYAAPLEDLHDGKLFRVRDEENLYGMDMPWPEAFKLKDKIAGRKISTTVMTEETDDQDTPEWVLGLEEQARAESRAHPVGAGIVAVVANEEDNLEEMRASAKRAASAAAAAANGRHASSVAAVGARSAPKRTPPAPAPRARSAPSMTSKLLATPAREPEPEPEDPGIDPHDALDGLGEIPDDESIAAELAAMTDGTADA